MIARSALCFLIAAAALSAPGASRIDVFEFDNETQRERYRALIEELRCPKCLNTNIAGSDAPIAQDLRALVHRMVVVEGREDQEIRDFLHARYGDFVLYDPPFNARTYLIWLLPLGVTLLVVFALWRVLGRARSRAVPQLDANDRARLEALKGGS